MKIFNEKAQQASKYTHIGSTQANKSLNMTVSSKASKRVNYSESTSLKRRVEAAVAQKTLGYKYIAYVSCPNLGMSCIPASLSSMNTTNKVVSSNPDLHAHDCLEITGSYTCCNILAMHVHMKNGEKTLCKQNNIMLSFVFLVCNMFL